RDTVQVVPSILSRPYHLYDSAPVLPRAAFSVAHCGDPHVDLNSFPTRRSSDLGNILRFPQGAFSLYRLRLSESEYGSFFLQESPYISYASCKITLFFIVN